MAIFRASWPPAVGKSRASKPPPSALPITDFPIHTQEFQNIPLNQPTFDVVTAWAVLEHVYDPMAYFSKAVQVLKKNGLFIFLVPNFHSVASLHLFCEHVPRHLYFYTGATVRQHLQKSGLALEEEDNNRNIHKVAPANWLKFVLQTRLRRKNFTFVDIPLTSRQFRKAHQLQRGIHAALKYTAYSPLSVIDRMVRPFIGSAQMLRGTYGNTTYVARNP